MVSAQPQAVLSLAKSAQVVLHDIAPRLSADGDAHPAGPIIRLYLHEVNPLSNVSFGFGRRTALIQGGAPL